jgi:predicted dienelactone hydrolase
MRGIWRLCGCLLAFGAAYADEQTLDLAGLKVTVWSPPAMTTEAVPTLFFSHGFHGCATQSRFLMSAFAAAGYFVFAPNHRDATCGGGQAHWLERPAMRFGDPKRWNDTTYRDRANDLTALLDALRGDQRFGTRIDPTRVGLVGHSLGGYTVLGLAGAWPSWKVDGIKAVLALSPYAHPFTAHETLAQLGVPVMYQGGTWDFSITPMIRMPGGAYEQTPPPKYFVEFAGAGHLAWTDMRAGDHDAITAYSIAFMDHFVKGNPPRTCSSTRAPMYRSCVLYPIPARATQRRNDARTLGSSDGRSISRIESRVQTRRSHDASF